MKLVKVKNTKELAKALGLSSAEGAEIVFRSQLNDKIIAIVKKKKIRHLDLAKLVGSSRTRMTALLNRNTSDISTDLMLRVLSALGYKIEFKISKAS